MPVTGCRVTMIMRDGKFGISETHIKFGATDIASTAPFALRLVKKRMALCAAGVAMDYVRLSMEGVFRDSDILDADDIGDLSPPPAVVSFDADFKEKNTTDQSKAALLIRMDGGAQSHSKIYLSGIPDYVIRYDDNANFVGLFAPWRKLLDNYTNELITNWGFAGIVLPTNDNPAKQVTAAVLQDVTALLGLVTTSAAPIDAGRTVQLRDFRMTNKAYRSINGVWQIASRVDNSPSNGLSTYYLRNTAGITPSTILTMGTLFLRDKTTYKYSSAKVRGPTTRKRGNRSLAGPGKKSTKKVVNPA